MDKRTRTLVDAIVGGVSTIGIAVVTYINPEHATMANTIIGAVDTLIVVILNLFTKKEQTKKE